MTQQSKHREAFATACQIGGNPRKVKRPDARTQSGPPNILELVAELNSAWDFIEAVLPLIPVIDRGDPLTADDILRELGAVKGALVLGTISPKTPIRVPGSLYFEYRRCRRSSCHCAHSGRLHGPYAFHYWRRRGKTYREYIPRRHIEWVRQAVEGWRTEKRRPYV